MTARLATNAALRLPLHCLLVEDNPADVAIVRALLQDADGIDLAVAGSLAEALAAIGQRYPDVVLLDLSLPDSSGLDTFISLHMRAKLAPVVVLSGLNEPEMVLDAVRLGAQDFLIKGQLSPEVLKRSLQFAVARHMLARQGRNSAHRAMSAPPGVPELPNPQPLSPELPALPLDPHADRPVPRPRRGRQPSPDSGPGDRRRTAQTATVFSLAGGLGSGGSADVVLARQVNLERDVAVKFLRTASDDPQQRELFQAEARVTAWLEHPNIIPIYDLGENFFVMRRVHGDTLTDLLARRRQLGEGLSSMVEILLKVTDAVAFAHSRGVIHRDIKPDNIMVGAFGEVLLLDWGLALTVRVPADGSFRAQPIPAEPKLLCQGTAGFLAPEIATAMRAQVGYATDVWLLGATLYSVLAGRPPFDNPDVHASLQASASAQYLPVVMWNPAAPAALVNVQLKAMQPDPAERGTVHDFADGLRAWLTAGKVGSRPRSR